MKKTVAYLLSTFVVLAAPLAQAVQTEAVVEIAVSAEKTSLQDYAVNGGPILTMGSDQGASNVRVKCNRGILDVSMIVFIQGSALRTQLTSKVASMDSCREKLKTVLKEIEDGAGKLRIEIQKNHTIDLATAE